MNTKNVLFNRKKSPTGGITPLLVKVCVYALSLFKGLCFAFGTFALVQACTYNRTISLSNTPDNQQVNYQEQTEIKYK